MGGPIEFVGDGDGGSTESQLLRGTFDRRRLLQYGLGGALAAGTALLGGGASGALVRSAADLRRGSVEESVRTAAVKSKTLVIASSRAVNSLDPNTVAGLGAQTAWQICYDTLFDISYPAGLGAAEAFLAHFEPTPQLSTSWTSSKSKLIWHFELNKKAISSAGRPLTSADVLYSMERHLALVIYAGIFLNNIGVTKASQFVADGDHAFTMTLPEVIDSSYMLQLLGALIMPIYDSEEVKSHATTADPWAKNWMATHTAGFGPYVVESLASDGSQCVFTARKNYYGKVSIPKVIWNEEAETSTQLELLLRGDAQVTDQLSPEQIKTVAAHKGTKVTPVASSGEAYMAFANNQAPFSDVALHQGLAYAIDFNAIVHTVWKGTAQTWKSVIPPWFQGYTDKYWAYKTNVAKAKSLLAPYLNAGLALQYDAGNALHVTLAELIQGSLAGVGMQIKLSGIDSATFAADESAASKTWWLDTGSTPVIPDSLYALQLLYPTKPTQTLLHYSNTNVDAAIAQLAHSKTTSAQDALIKRAQKYIMSDLPIIPIAYTGGSVTSASDLTGFRGHGGNFVKATELSFT